MEAFKDLSIDDTYKQNMVETDNGTLLKKGENSDTCYDKNDRL